MSAGCLDVAEGNALTKLQPTKVNSLSTMDKKLSLLNEKMDKLLHFQEDLTGKLQRVNKGIDDVEKGINKLTVSRAAPDEPDEMKKGLKLLDSPHQANIQSICSEVLKLMKTAQLDALKHKERLAKIEKRFDTLDKVINSVGEVLRNSKVVDFILKGIVPWKKGSPLEILVEAKDKPEESGAKPKHGLSNRGTQTESKKPLEETKSVKKLNLNKEACEKVNASSVVANKSDSKSQAKERTAQQQAVEGAGKKQSSKSCQQQKDVGVKALNQHNGLPFVNQDHVGNQNVPVKAHDTDGAPRLDECSRQPVHQKLGENENKPPLPSAASREAVPSPSQAISDTGCEVTSTRISINVHVAEMKEKIETKEEISNDHRHRCPKVKSPSSTSAEVHEQLPGKLKLKQSPKNISTEPNQEVKGDSKQNEHASKTGKQQLLLNKSKPGKNTEDKSELKCKPKTSQNTSATELKKDLGVEVKIHQETTKAEDSLTVTASEKRESESASSGGSENDVGQCAGMVLQNTTSLEASKEPSTQDEVVIDDSPSPPAPFEHRIVSVKQTEVTTCYSVCRHEVLGGGRFGQVHKCTEIATGLNLAAKIIKVKGAKEKEEVKNEINIMNQLNHVNLIQLYDAFEAKNNITLVMEYLDGGELFDRIIDENYHLTELDAILFTKQICEGVHYLHQHYILHLDLKPENILCVNRTGNQIKIIDFGLARRYKPREKLKVNFGTPEFLAPEVVNYDFVSFPTDMWSVGVITYMLLSGLSPFLGETDAETMNYVVNCSWDFDAEAFEQLSEEAKDFISRLLVKEKSCRMSATQCLKHEWLNNLPAKAKKSKLRLKSQLLLQSYMAQRKWKKHFYVVAAANRLKRFQSMAVKLP
ncbi:myosin light chain kinase 3 isoform X1 [Anas platyrhynchos]|uniref:myosin light chain kinase 3 isoform X1 n=1 Tax=Anas platyrhynchos TaxID=8839 RepID=UPI000F7C4284|eukprot:XP_005024201.2 myosin light chain kinase 3 isoform X1 [Anas platyrhynchos]